MSAGAETARLAIARLASLVCARPYDHAAVQAAWVEVNDAELGVDGPAWDGWYEARTAVGALQDAIAALTGRYAPPAAGDDDTEGDD